MNESSESISFKNVEQDLPLLTQRILDSAYLSPIVVDYDAGKFKFSGKTMIDDGPLLFAVDVDRSTGKGKCTINSENTVINSMLLKQLKKAIEW